MAVGDRSRKLRQRVQTVVRGDVDSPDVIYDALNRIQARICEEAGAKNDRGTIAVVGGTELYNVPDGFTTEESIISPTSTPLTKKSLIEIAAIKQAGISLGTTTGDPIYYYKWNNQIGLVNAAGGAPADSGSFIIYYWRKPISDGTEDIGEAIDPIIGSRWDECLFYGAVADLIFDPKWWALFENQMIVQRSTEAGYRDVTRVVAYVREED